MTVALRESDYSDGETPVISRRKRTADDVSFQITPMIDMTFLLLIFFMVTSKLSKERIKMDIRLPVASAAAKPEDLSGRDVINIDADGRYFLGDRAVAAGELRLYLADRFKKYPPLRLYIRADKTTPSKLIKELMGMAAQAGATEVIIGSTQR